MLDLEDYLHILRAVASLTRFRILNILYQNKQPLSQQQLVDILEVSKSNVSRHAKILRNSNLIIQWKGGKHIYYALSPYLKPKTIITILKEVRKDTILQHDLKKLKRK